MKVKQKKNNTTTKVSSFSIVKQITLKKIIYVLLFIKALALILGVIYISSIFMIYLYPFLLGFIYHLLDNPIRYKKNKNHIQKYLKSENFYNNQNYFLNTKAKQDFSWKYIQKSFHIASLICFSVLILSWNLYWTIIFTLLFQILKGISIIKKDRKNTFLTISLNPKYYHRDKNKIYFY